MTEVVFLDSSVLFNILEVPHKCSDRDSVVAEFTQLTEKVPSATPVRLWTLDKALSAHC